MLNKLSIYSIIIVLQNLNLLRLMGMHLCRILHVKPLYVALPLQKNKFIDGFAVTMR